MSSYSLDLRERVMAAYDTGDQTQGQICQRFSISRSCLRQLRKLRQATGSLVPRRHRGGRQAIFGAEQLSHLAALVHEQSDATVGELRQRLKHRHGIVASHATVVAALAKLDLRLKKSRCRPASSPVPMCSRPVPSSAKR